MESERSPGQAAIGPAAFYADRVRHFDGEVADKIGSVRRYGRLRLAVFATAVVGAWLLIFSGRSTAGWLFLASAVLTFAILVARHRVARRRLRRAELMAEFNREGIARVERRWSDLPAAPVLSAPNDHDYADDLDLYGNASLLHLAGVCATGAGWRTLQAWLLAPSDAETIARRQEAVRELASAFDFRDRLAAEARLMEGDATEEVDGFLAWAESATWLRGHRWLRAMSFVLAAVNVTAIVLHSLGMVPVPAVAWPLLISTIVFVQWRKRINRIFDEADDGESGVRRYGPVLGHLAGTPGESDYAARLRERLGAGTRSAQREVTTLRRLLDLADVRRSPLFHLPLAVVLQWDVHVLAALERWKTRSGGHVRDWLDAAGEGEALAALAALAADHPDWVMPTIDPAAGALQARALGHPLLAPEVCVRNDVEVGPAGSFLLVTGSNMSGKSTLLKALGLNVALAQAGGPVCAESLRMPPLRVVTSIHITDSLAAGVSYFMAGLQRLKRVVDATAQPAIAAPSTLYLLDEVLQGTNSAERRIAARTVLRKLLATRAIGAATTHDLTLADADDLVARAVPVHFTETVGEGELAFDYQLRDGIATSTNALRLLELVGLGDGA